LEEPVKRLFGFVSITIVNLIPLFGTLVLGWNAWQLIFLYLAESVAISIFGMLKVGICSFSPRGSVTFREALGNIFLLFIFTVFFLGFLIIIVGIFQANMYLVSNIDPNYNPFWPDPIQFNLVNFINSPLLAVAGFFLIQLMLFIRDFLLTKTYKTVNMARYFGEPLKRIVIMHLAAVVGGWFIVSRLTANPPNYIFLLWIGMKLVLDLFSYGLVQVKDSVERNPVPV
jgi:hypothetical protein